MNGTRTRAAVRWGMIGGLALSAAMTASAADTWIKPTAEELSMTSIPGYPGAPAVILFREEITKDDLHVMQHYERIKVLTEKGKQYANVELRFFASRSDGYDDYADDKNITDIQGRTIHPDGTIIPFTGKPYLKMISKGKTASYQARVFTLPDVEVGSIVEYRYATRINDNVVEPPSWFIQGDLYTKSVHFLWTPTQREVGSEAGTANTINWFPLLPDGVTVQRRETPSPGPNGPQQTFEVTAKNIPPEPEEDFMPPLSSFTYRVLFYYSPYRTSAEFWKAKGKRWSKMIDSFASSDKLNSATQTVTAGADTQDAKLRKIYAAVMKLENTDFTRSREKTEDKAEGVGKTTNAADVYQHGRGSSDQLTAVFVGMARAAGMKAYFMLIPDRSRRLFTPYWLSMEQFDNMVAIVNVDGKEQFFDPGQRYCPYGQLAWQDTMVQGMRETEGGQTDFAGTPGATFKETKTQRIADLTLDEHGEIHGTATLSFIGSTALQWRHRALEGDEESLKKGLRTDLEEMIPKTLEVKVTSVENLTDYEKPLVAKYELKGGMGTATGKRLILPADIFLNGESNTFPHEKREMAVYFHYPQSVLDAVRVKYPESMTLEASPAQTRIMFQNLGQYNLGANPGPHSVTVQRTYLFNTVIVYQKEYDQLRTFYSQFEAKDKESIVLKAEAAPAAAGN